MIELGWDKYKGRLNISEYSNYTTLIFLTNEGSSSVLLISTFSFFVYTIPQNILFCLILYGIFHILKNYRISQRIRKFHFLKTVIIIVIFQENLCFLVFICFSHIQHPFSFNFADKLSLTFTVLFLFGCFFFTFAFYFLVFRYLGKKSSYFTEFTYR